MIYLLASFIRDKDTGSWGQINHLNEPAYKTLAGAIKELNKRNEAFFSEQEFIRKNGPSVIGPAGHVHHVTAAESLEMNGYGPLPQFDYNVYDTRYREKIVAADA